MKNQEFENFRAQNPLFSNSKKRGRKSSANEAGSNVVGTGNWMLETGDQNKELGPPRIELGIFRV